jgi:hypothetical protein
MKEVNVVGNKILNILVETFPNTPIIKLYNTYYQLSYLGMVNNGMLFVQFNLDNQKRIRTKRFVWIR